MEEKPFQFESGHPDLNTASAAENKAERVGALGAVDNLLSFGFRSEKLNQILKQMKDSVSINNCGGKPGKWYVQYYEYNPVTKQKVRHRESGYINRQHDLVKRQILIEQLQAEIMMTIGQRIIQRHQSDNKIQDKINQYLADKKTTLRGTSIKNMKLALRYFNDYLNKNNLQKMQLHQINRQNILQFRTELSAKSGNKSVNGHISFVRTFFNYYKDNFENEVLKNPCDGVKKLPETSETHVAYTQEMKEKIFKHLADHDEQLLLYCQFVGMGFFRCNEIRFLKIGHIDFINKTITIPASASKTRKRQVRPLLESFFELLQGLQSYSTESYIFSYGGPGAKQIHYNYFQKRFKKVKKEFNLNKRYTVYGFRHTFISRMIQNGAKWHELMKYTGHTTMEAFSKYARSLVSAPAEDLSKFI